MVKGRAVRTHHIQSNLEHTSQFVYFTLGGVSENSLLWGAAGTPGTGRWRQVVARYKWSLRQVSLDLEFCM